MTTQSHSDIRRQCMLVEPNSSQSKGLKHEVTVQVLQGWMMSEHYSRLDLLPSALGDSSSNFPRRNSRSRERFRW